MEMILPKSEQGIPVFHFWKSLGFRTRMVLSLGLILFGLAVQVYTVTVLPGIIIVLLGNLFLLVKGYNNGISSVAFDPKAVWKQVNADMLDQILQRNKKIQRWDRAMIDMTNGAGGFIGVCILVGSIAGMSFGRSLDIFWLKILCANMLFLFFPHWITGVRRILTLPGMITKINMIQSVINNSASLLKTYAVEYFIQAQGLNNQLPGDLKFRIALKDQKEDFLGLYGQVVLNSVNGTDYPYFYSVIVAKKGFGLRLLWDLYTAPKDLTAEYSIEGDVEVLVVRRFTTKTSGYNTPVDKACFIFQEGVKLAEKANAPDIEKTI